MTPDDEARRDVRPLLSKLSALAIAEPMWSTSDLGVQGDGSATGRVHLVELTIPVDDLDRILDLAMSAMEAEGP